MPINVRWNKNVNIGLHSYEQPIQIPFLKFNVFISILFEFLHYLLTVFTTVYCPCLIPHSNVHKVIEIFGMMEEDELPICAHRWIFIQQCHSMSNYLWLFAGSFTKVYCCKQINSFQYLIRIPRTISLHFF